MTPPLPAKKRSALPWVLSGCGLVLVVGVIGLIIFFMSVSKLTLLNQNVAGPKTKQKTPALSESEAQTKSPPVKAPPDWTTYTHKLSDVPANLGEDFVAFSVSYPPDFRKKASRDASVVLQKLDPSNQILEEISINPGRFPNEPTASQYESALDDIAGFMKKVLSNLEPLGKESATIAGVPGRALSYRGQLKEVTYFGKAIVLFPKGSRHGLIVILQAQESVSGITSADKLDSRGDLATILQTFRW